LSIEKFISSIVAEAEKEVAKEKELAPQTPKSQEAIMC